MVFFEFIDGVVEWIKFAILIPVALWVLDKLNSGFQLSRWLLSALVFWAAAFIFFFSRAGSDPLMERFSFALDVSLAHTLVTFPVVTLSLSLFWAISMTLFMLEIFLTSLVDEWFPTDVGSESFFNIVMVALIILTGLKIYQYDRYVLVESDGLQNFVFAGYDPNLGLQASTTYRMSNVVDSLFQIKDSLASDPVFSKLFRFFAAIFAVIVAFKTLLEVIAFLARWLNKRSPLLNR